MQPFLTVIYMYSIIQCMKELKDIKVKDQKLITSEQLHESV